MLLVTPLKEEKYIATYEILSVYLHALYHDQSTNSIWEEMKT